jgi:hypothetical protein
MGLCPAAPPFWEYWQVPADLPVLPSRVGSVNGVPARRYDLSEAYPGASMIVWLAPEGTYLLGMRYEEVIEATDAEEMLGAPPETAGPYTLRWTVELDDLDDPSLWVDLPGSN